ncbi:uncharacterized protein Eint_041460 [Encephalitozoon intestinalis ATCC 50506]|uniref:Uncharacterized protein n=1 Tax=Encephalitozoon intestinalis (strain ATCC 50506) TaxID=876142 RepID=E0S6U8_ENCIT|nr:uncharacterized protein Eint_041460 [Encephalitozoon intestinalis ATCC 50506]ADM11433.1 hypothetical protein Eint_041460 [Encephalitozoon intestinalis ATCC 50506]UTX45129.1 putative RNA polymerase III subunit RPC8 [Encephalitozoon intestinalis]
MVKFKLVKAKMSVEIGPEFLENPMKAVSKCMASKLLIYSHKLGGIPLSFAIKDIEHSGTVICETGSVEVTASSEYVVLTLPVGGVMSSFEGRTLGIFNTDVDGSKEYTGDFIVKGIKLEARSFFTIVGTHS